MQCSSCKTELAGGVAHCPSCGTKVSNGISESTIASGDATTVSSPYDSLQQLPASDELPQNPYGHNPYGPTIPTPPSPPHPYEQKPYSPAIPAPPRPPRHRPVKAVGLVIGILALLLILGAGISVFLWLPHNTTKKVTHQGVNTTSTTKVAGNPYPAYLPGNGTLALYDPLTGSSSAFPSNEACLFMGEAYHVKADKGYYYGCSGGNSFTNFAAEVRVTVLQGLCAGMMVRADEANSKYYLFEICSNADYGVFQYFGTGANDYTTIKLSHSTAITSGLNQQNVLAVVANENILTVYVNKQLVDRFSLSDTPRRLKPCGFCHPYVSGCRRHGT
jgi:hypothetical protein